MPNDGDVFFYTFDDMPVSPMIPIELDKEDPDLIRLVTYNVLLNDGWEGAQKLPNLASVVKALDADIYAFQESSNTSAAVAKNYMDLWLPIATTDGWYVLTNGDRITCSKWPFIESWNLFRKLATLIDLPPSYPNDLLLLNAHLSCCGGNYNRQEQVDEFAAFILDAKSTGGDIDLPQNTPIIFTGDMNFVGYSQQVETTLTGDIQNTITYGEGGALDWDNTDLADAKPIHSNQRMVYTWRNLNGEGFPPGRLDYHFYTDAVLNLDKSFILQTELMDPSVLSLHDLDSLDTKLVSDHLPVTVDYSFKSMTGTRFSKNVTNIDVVIYPNPTSGVINIETTGELTSVVLRDMLGNPIKINSISELQFEAQFPSNGIYFVDMIIDNVRVVRRLIVLQ